MFFDQKSHIFPICTDQIDQNSNIDFAFKMEITLEFVGGGRVFFPYADFRTLLPELSDR